MKKKDYFSEIINSKEAKEFARVIKKWDVLSKNLETVNVPIVLPDLLWISKPGVGKTRLLKLLSEYLFDKKNLIEFCGNVKYFEFMLDYCSPLQNFNEIKRMLSAVSIAAGYRDKFKGIISIDIDEWIGHFEEKHFLSFLEYLSSNSNDWLIVFNVTSDDKSELCKLESILSMYFRIEKSNLYLLETEDFLNFIVDKLGSYNLSVDDSAKNLLLKTIEKLRQHKYFDGYKTLVMLCQDIIYEFLSIKETNENVITEEHLKWFAPGSGYIERATWKADNKNKIGFMK